MAQFICKILDSSGVESEIIVEADHKKHADTVLKSEGKFAVSIKEKPGSKKPDAIDVANLFSSVSNSQIVLFFQNLGVLISSGISIVHALDILYRQAEKKGLKKLVKALSEDVESGLDFSEAMSKHKVFSRYDVSMIRAAEASGEMDIIMDQIATQMEARQDFKAQMITSMIYPAIVVLLAGFVITALSLFVVPIFAGMLKGGKSLPWPTQVILDFSSWFKEWWKVVFGSIGAAIISMVLMRKTEEGGHLIDLLLLKVPVIGKIVQCGVVVNYSRNLSILLKSGVPLSDSLIIVKDTINNHVGVKVIKKMVDNILEGKNMSEPLREAKHVFPSMVAEMTATGEETGEMDKVLTLTANAYQKKLETFVKRMNALIEPLLILGLGGIVGFTFYALIAGVLSAYGI